MDGNIVRQYQSSLRGYRVNIADNHGRILIVGRSNRMELLDSELNVLYFTGPKLPKHQLIIPDELHYDRLRNEAMGVHYDGLLESYVITTYRFTEK